jgi:hypothetical protein
MYDGVEPMDGMCSVLDGTRRAVGLNQAVAALNDATLSRLMLGLRVTGQSVLDSVAKAVLRVGVRIQRYVVLHSVRVSPVGGGSQQRDKCHNLQNEWE